MSRWEPDARGRMQQAALELFVERGFEQTSASDIAGRAGVTERTFFRHFTDKREVLFAGAALEETAHEGVLAAPDDATPFEAGLAGILACAVSLEDRRQHATLRTQIVVTTPGLRERELLKLATMTEATSTALRLRGVPDVTADLAAHSAVTVFYLAFRRWVNDTDGGERTFADAIADIAHEFRTLS